MKNTYILAAALILAAVIVSGCTSQSPAVIPGLIVDSCGMPADDKDSAIDEDYITGTWESDCRYIYDNKMCTLNYAFIYDEGRGTLLIYDENDLLMLSEPLDLKLKCRNDDESYTYTVSYFVKFDGTEEDFTLLKTGQLTDSAGHTFRKSKLTEAYDSI